MDTSRRRRFWFRGTFAGTRAGRVTFVLEPAGDATTLRFRESGYREMGWEAAVLEAQYEDHRQGWDFYLPRLVAAAEKQP